MALHEPRVEGNIPVSPRVSGLLYFVETPYMCVCLYVYMDMYVNMYIYVCIYIHICMYTCICVYLYIYVLYIYLYNLCDRL